MHPYAQYPPFFQYSQAFQYPQLSIQQFNPYQHQQYINNYLWLNYQRAQQTHLLFEGSAQSPPIIKQENIVKQEQTIPKQSNFEPVEIMTNLENSKSAQPLKTRLNIQSQKNKRKGKRSSRRKLYNIGHWTTKEHNLYLSFTEMNKDIMLNSDLKKQNKIFKQMSNFIKTRSPSQCRSHHQKFDPKISTSNNTSNLIECDNVGNQE